MIDHRKEAERLVELVPQSTTHAVLALLDYLQQQDDAAVEDYEEIVTRQKAEIERLKEQLQGTRDALATREAALTEEMKQAQKSDGQRPVL